MLAVENRLHRTHSHRFKRSVIEPAAIIISHNIIQHNSTIKSTKLMTVLVTGKTPAQMVPSMANRWPHPHGKTSPEVVPFAWQSTDGDGTYQTVPGLVPVPGSRSAAIVVLRVKGPISHRQTIGQIARDIPAFPPKPYRALPTCVGLRALQNLVAPSVGAGAVSRKGFQGHSRSSDLRKDDGLLRRIVVEADNIDDLVDEQLSNRIDGGRPVRGSSTSPSSRLSTNRVRHLPTVAVTHPISRPPPCWTNPRRRPG